MADLRAYALTTVAVVALAGAASAADLLPPPPAMEPAPPILAPELGGWYIRGDVGVGLNNAPTFSTLPDALAAGLASGYLTKNSNENYYNNAMTQAALLDFGVGYQVNSWFRADVTGELRGGATFSGLETLNDGGDGTGVGNGRAKQFTDFYRGNISSYLAMANAYADLGTWYGVTPYVGAGLGVAFNHTSGFTDTGGAAVGARSPISAVGGILGNSTTSNFAWALMAGLDFNVTHNLKLEFGYRYLDYGKASTGVSSCFAGPNARAVTFSAANCSSGGVKVSTRELTANDFRIGLRYYFDTPAPMPEAPLVRKY